MSYSVTIEAGLSYDNWVFITSTTLVLVFGKCQIVTMTCSYRYLQWLRYNDGKEKIIYEN